MRAVQIFAYKTEPRLEEVSLAEVQAGYVLVRIAAAGLNPLDTKIQQGFMHDFFPVQFPYTLGTDLAGTVEKIGADVTGWCVGDRVVARTDPPAGGALAMMALIPSSHLVKLPSSVSFETAAGIPTAAGTAQQALFEVAGLKLDQKVLIHAGAGGVGSFAIQLAHNVGARVIATASGEGVAIARSLGADEVIDYQTQKFENQVSGVDVVLDTIGGDTQQRSFGVLRKNGYLAATAAPPDEALMMEYGVKGSFVFHQSNAMRLARLVDQVAGGTLRVLIDRVVPGGQFAEAFAYQASGRAHGKVIVWQEAV